jgi:hypothetical protein
MGKITKVKAALDALDMSKKARMNRAKPIHSVGGERLNTSRLLIIA